MRAGWLAGLVWIEGGTPAGGATGAGMGHLVVMDDSPAQLALTAYSRSLWQAQLSGAAAKVGGDGELRHRYGWPRDDAEEMAEVSMAGKGSTATLARRGPGFDLRPSLPLPNRTCVAV